MYNIISGTKVPNIYTLHSICNALQISLSDFFNLDDTVIALRGKEAILIKIFREISLMSQDTLIRTVPINALLLLHRRFSLIFRQLYQ